MFPEENQCFIPFQYRIRRLYRDGGAARRIELNTICALASGVFYRMSRINPALQAALVGYFISRFLLLHLTFEQKTHIASCFVTRITDGP